MTISAEFQTPQYSNQLLLHSIISKNWNCSLAYGTVLSLNCLLQIS